MKGIKYITTLIFYLAFLIITVLTRGLFIKLYGETCGLKLYDFSSVVNSVVMIGSYWCESLPRIINMQTWVIEHLWIHLIAVGCGSIMCIYQNTTQGIAYVDPSKYNFLTQSRSLTKTTLPNENFLVQLDDQELEKKSNS